MTTPIDARRGLRIRVRLSLAFAALLALVVLLAALAMRAQDSLDGALERLLGQQSAARDTIHQITTSAEDATRKLLTLMHRERTRRIPAYADIDAAHRRLDTALQRLDQTLPVAASAEVKQLLMERLRDFRRQYDLTVDRIEADDFEAARQSLSGPVEEALSSFLVAVQTLSAQTDQAAALEVERLRNETASTRRWIYIVCAVAFVLGGVLAVAVTRSIARPLRRLTAAADRIAQGDYQLDLPVDRVDELGEVAQAMGTVAQAVAERETALRRMGNTDLLTGLAQRARFIAEGDSLLARLAQGDEVAALLCIDVDRLKAVNAVLGFEAGDALLRGAAGKLNVMFEGIAAYGRLGGGTFVALVPLLRYDQIGAMAAHLRDEVEHKLSWQGQGLDLSVSLGIAHWPVHADSTEGLLRRAEQAMFEAKRARQHVVVYNPGLEASRELHLSLLSDLQAAIQGDQLRQYLQPKRHLRSGRVVGVEALVRWQHPERGWLPPSEFVPFAESSGRIRLITQWMLTRAAQTLARWQAEGVDLYIAVNVTTLDIQDLGLPERVRAVLAEYRVDPRKLQLEVTETGLMASGNDPITVMHGLRRLGVRLAIDDFGTGQSSLGYLQRLPVDELKVDRSFVENAHLDPKRRALLSAIVGIGHSLGLTVTGEGVETVEELGVVGDCGCDLVQGFHVARPLDLDDFEAWRLDPDNDELFRAEWQRSAFA